MVVQSRLTDPAFASVPETRAELEAALARAESDREQLEAGLAEAQAALANTVSGASRLDADREAAEARVEAVRARCRQLRAALKDPEGASRIDRIRERIDALPRPQVQAVPTPVAPARAQPGAGRLAVHWRNIPPHAREAIGLLALTLAYMNYYFIDVQLQIVRLPTVVLFTPL